MVGLDEIADPKNDYNLNLPRYIDSSAPEDVHDLVAHLRGGIPDADLDALSAYWEVLPALRAELAQPLDGRPGYSALRVDAGQVKATIAAHPEFQAYARRVHDAFAEWRGRSRPCMEGIGPETKPKALIAALSEDMLATFARLPLIDGYDMYQRLMTYWTEALQDDVYLVAGDSWRAAAQLRRIADEGKDKANKSKEKPDLQLGKAKYKADLLPPALLIARYFAAEQRAIDALEAEREALAGQIEALKDEHGGEGGLLEAVMDDDNRLMRAYARAHRRELDATPNPDDADERHALDQLISVFDAEAEACARLKAAQTALTEQLIAKYAALSEAEVKALAMDDKWLAALGAEVDAELARVTQALTGRMRALAERYAKPLSALEAEVEALGAKVASHLRNMGALT